MQSNQHSWKAHHYRWPWKGLPIPNWHTLTASITYCFNQHFILLTKRERHTEVVNKSGSQWAIDHRQQLESMNIFITLLQCLLSNPQTCPFFLPCEAKPHILLKISISLAEFHLASPVQIGSPAGLERFWEPLLKVSYHPSFTKSLYSLHDIIRGKDIFVVGNRRFGKLFAKDFGSLMHLLRSDWSYHDIASSYPKDIPRISENVTPISICKT